MMDIDTSIAPNVNVLESKPEHAEKLTIIATPRDEAIINEKLVLSKSEGKNNAIESDQVDDASVLVIILQGDTRPCDKNISNLKWIFSDPYFTVQVCVVDPPPNIPSNKTLTEAQYLENYYMRKALAYAAEGPYIVNSDGGVQPQYFWSSLPCIIIKDNSVSNITPAGVTTSQHGDPNDNIIGGMKRRISRALLAAKSADLFFLCKWNDACNKYVDIKGANSIDHGSSLKWSTQPTATQAVMYTPASRDYIRASLISANEPLSTIFNSDISSGKLLATVFVPNIIDFDISLATQSSDYAKLNECAPVTTTTTQSNNVTAFLWFFILVILVIALAYALIVLGPK